VYPAGPEPMITTLAWMMLDTGLFSIVAAMPGARHGRSARLEAPRAQHFYVGILASYARYATRHSHREWVWNFRRPVVAGRHWPF
jgi:hypothetical protein